jgi:hypothetical protein
MLSRDRHVRWLEPSLFHEIRFELISDEEQRRFTDA